MLDEEDTQKYEDIVQEHWQYYEPRFKRFASGNWVSWNWAAFFATMGWLRYRKLYAWSWAYFFVSTPFLLAILMVVFSGDACERALDPVPVYSWKFLVLFCLSWLVPPLFANYLYYRHVKAQIRKNDFTPSLGKYDGAIMLQILFLIVVIAAVPQYADYRYKAMVSEGITLASPLKTEVSEYFIEHDRFPDQLDEQKSSAPGKYVISLVPDSSGRIEVNFGKGAGMLSGHSLYLIPDGNNNGIAWGYSSRDLPGQCLPGSFGKR